MTVRRRFAIILMGAALLAAPLARADGDPASDVLYGGWVFVPFTDKLSGQEEVLQKTVLAAKRSGYPIKVAVIGGRSDLEQCRSSTPSLSSMLASWASSFVLSSTEGACSS